MRNNYRILDPPLGVGAFGEVRKCMYTEMCDLAMNLKTQQPFKEYRAVKILKKEHMDKIGT